jgi:hypothetical protein
MYQITPAILLEEINRKHDMHWRLDHKLTGGILGGAWKLTGKGRRAVLKVHDPSSSVPHNPDAAKVVAYIRKHGYPTPKWLVSGFLESGISYSVQEFISGKSLQHLDISAAQIIIDIVQLQRSLQPPTNFNWSTYMVEHVFSEHPSHQKLQVAGRAVAHALQEALAIVAPYQDLKLEENEMVHCDLSVSNILVDDGKLAGVVDIDAAGRGCAVYDALSEALNGVKWDADPEAVNLLHSYAIKAYGAGPVAIAASTLVIGGLAWRLESSSDEMVRMVAEKSLDWLSQIRTLIS